MSTLKKILITFGRLPLLFIIDSVCKGSFLDFSGLNFGPLGVGTSLQYQFNNKYDTFSYDWFYNLLATASWFSFQNAGKLKSKYGNIGLLVNVNRYKIS